MTVYKERLRLTINFRSTEKVPGMFASIIVTLPSAYEGASLHLSHAGQTKVVDLASSSATTTSVLAWYSDVYHAVHPVLSGYRLALSYNLVMPPSPTSVRPSLPKMDDAVARLRHVLLSWRRDQTGSAPVKLVYNLDHKYSQISLGTGSLKGKDAHMLSFLRPIAEELRFRLYLANVELHESGQAENSGGGGYRGGGWGRRRWGYSRYDDDEDDDDHGGMAELEESTLSVTNIVDLDGITVKLDGIKIDQDKDMIPYRLKDQGVDQEEYEGYQGNVSFQTLFVHGG